MTAPDARDELREALVGALPGFSRPTARLLADALVPVVTAWHESQARARAAEEIERLAEERTWTTEYDNEVVSTRELYEQVARLRGELEPVTFDFPPDAALAADDRTDAR